MPSSLQLLYSFGAHRIVLKLLRGDFQTEWLEYTHRYGPNSVRPGMYGTRQCE